MAARTFLDQQGLKRGARGSASSTDTAEGCEEGGGGWATGGRRRGALTFTPLHNPQDYFLELLKILLQPERNVSYL